MSDREASLLKMEEKHNLYKRLFATDDGAEVLKDIKQICFMTNTTFSSDGLEMAYREGMRCVAMHIETLIELDTEKMKEALNG